MWIVIAVLIVIGVFVKVRSKKFSEVPTGFQNLIEMIVEVFDDFTASNMGESGRKFSAYFGGLFFFILFANLSGLFGLRPPTANYAVPLGLALMTFVMIQANGVKAKGTLKYLKSLTEPVVLLTPLNIIGELANPVSLSFRLFGNIIGGTILMGLYYGLLPVFVKVGFPAFLHFYFDVFAGVLQAFVFTMLSMVFVSGAME
jgi:F-type H+-transporting ATPase subunit a